MRCFTVAIGSLVSVASLLSAQARTGAISGVVRDSLGAPIPFVEITAIKAAKVVRSDSIGRFVIAELPAANTDISFRRLAFIPAILMIAVPPDDTTEVVVTLGVVARELKGVVVQEHPAQLRQLVAFESRRIQGVGKFITRAQIEKRNPMRLSDMLRSIPGTMLISADNGRTGVRFTRGAGNKCPPQYIVDGMEAFSFSIDDIQPSEVEGVELYAGSAGVPPEYNKLFGTSICGTIIIWSRIPGGGKSIQP
jgi:hypothetical protein